MRQVWGRGGPQGKVGPGQARREPSPCHGDPAEQHKQDLQVQNLDSDMIATITFAADTQPLPLASAVTTPASEETDPHADSASFRKK